MSRWPGKYVIGLTGNIATGKSVVRKMLEHLGAFGIDADGLSHQAMGKGGPAFADVVKNFGQFIIGDGGEIDRQVLGNLVFANAKALAKLEAIIHPIVKQAVDLLAGRASQRVIVIEAIKLLEGELAGWCDSIWVVNVPEEIQIARLVQKRKMSIDQARIRIKAQPPQVEKLAKATVVIDNLGTFEETWLQVQAAWSKLVPPTRPLAPGKVPVPATAPLAEAAPAATPVFRPGVAPTIKIRRGKPADAAYIAAFMSRATHKSLSRADVMEAFGQKAFLLAQVNNAVGALAGWQVENLVTRVDDFLLLPNVPPTLVVKPLLEAIESASRDLQSEAAFLFVPPTLNASAGQDFAASGYETVTADSLSITAWREAVRESQPPGTIVLFKKLREDRVLRPV